VIRVGLVRGPFLNPYETAPYHHLGPDFEVLGFAARKCFSEVGAVGLPVCALRCPETEVSRRYGRYLSFFTSFVGRAYTLQGLEPRLAGMDVIHAAETYFGFTLQSARAARRYGRPLVVSVKETIPDLERVHPVRRHGREGAVKAEVKQSAAVFLAASNGAAVALEQEGITPERIRVLRPSVDFDAFAPASREADQSFHILFVGPALWRKGIYDAVRALAWVRRCADARLRIVGTGADLGEALGIAERLQVRQAIELAGRVPYAQMPGQYQWADALLAPSIPTRTWQEQDSMAILEAVACAVPVVATLAGIRSELLGRDANWVGPGDFVDMGQRLLAVAGTLEDARGRASSLRLEAQNRHSLPAAAAQLADCYRHIL
jgi:glycosyltransferase involved in cell wall biosynthesis